MRVHDVFARKAAVVGVVAHGVEDLGGDDYTARAGPKSLERRPVTSSLTPSEYTSAVSKKLMPSLKGALDKRAACFFVQHPIAPLRRAVGHHAQANARDFEAGLPEVDVLHEALSFRLRYG